MRNHSPNDFHFSDVDTVDLKLKHDFPLVVSPRNGSSLDLTQWIKDNRNLLTAALGKYGAILFRGFGLNSAESFKAVTDDFGNILEYKERTSPRSKVLENIYSSTDYPAELKINMHNESSYSPNWPRKLMFFCNIEPKKGGETPLADSRHILSLLDPEVVEKFKRYGVMYKRTLGSVLGLSWQETFQTSNKEEVNRICVGNNMDHSWEGDTLKLCWKRPALQVHPQTGETVWFNHAFFYHPTVAYDPDVLEMLSEDEIPFSSYYGNGETIEVQAINSIKSAYDKAIVEFSWRKGDLLLVDNLLVAHGRNPFEGPRQILVALFNN